MINRIAIAAMGAAILGLSALPRPAAAQFYDGEGRRPFTLHTQDDIEIDRARVAHRQDLGVRGFGGYDGPVAYEGRDPDPYRGGWRGRGYDVPAYGHRRSYYGEGGLGVDLGYRRAGYGAAYGSTTYYGAPYRSVSAPIDYEPVGERSFAPDSSCLTEQSQSTTPAGWRKIVTHRTCYRR